jgi:hypothetical protein
MTFRYFKWMALIAVLVAVAGATTAQAALTGDDIGGPTRMGSTVEKSPGTYLLKAGGAQTWGTADSFHFAHQAQSGDFTATVRLNYMRTADYWTTGGIMARETLDAGSRNEFNGAALWGVSQQWREETDGDSFDHGVVGAGSVADTVAPVWMLLNRQGDLFTAAWAFDTTAGGVPSHSPWLGAQTHTFTNPLAADLEVGLAVTAQDNRQLARALFDNWKISAAALPAIEDFSTVARLANVGGKVGGAAYGLSSVSNTLVGTADWTLQKKIVGAIAAAHSPGLKSEWFTGNMNWDDANQIMTVVQPNIDWVNGNYPAATGWTGDHSDYSVRVTGEIELKAGTYRFQDHNDDYAKLTIDGTTLIDDNDWTDYATGTAFKVPPIVSVDIATDGWYPIEFLMSEGGGGDNGRLLWDNGDSAATLVTVPATAFRVAADVEPFSWSTLARGRSNVGNPTTDGLFGNVTVEGGVTYKLDAVVGSSALVSLQAVLSPGGSPTAVPEPSTMVLAGLGFVGLLACGWRRRTLA